MSNLEPISLLPYQKARENCGVPGDVGAKGVSLMH